MPALRPARRRAAVANVQLFPKSPILTFEALETRVLMCSTVAELVANGVPASIVHDDGHISRADYENLAPELRKHIDPHWVEEDAAPIDYDKLMGLPQYMSEAEAHDASATMADALPDFFPLMYQVNSNLDLTSQPGRALLKFGTQVNNQGGPSSLISGRPGVDSIPAGAPITSWVNSDGSQNVLQAVYNWTGSGYTLSHYRAGGRFTYHAGHGHFHFDGYADYKLRYRNANGTVGDYVTRGDGSGVVGSKTGFCLLTFSGTFTTESGQNSSTLQGFNLDTSVPSGCGLQQGVRVGRYDQYSSGLEGQWIDVAGVTPGQYFLEILLDGENAIAETNEANNAKTFLVTIPNYTPGQPITPDNFDSGGEHNDTFETAADLGEMGVFTQTSLTIHWGADKDWFEFDATSSGNGSITMTQSSGDVNLYLYGSDHVQLAASTNPGGSDAINFNFVKGQEYYILAESYNSTTSNNYQLALNIKPTLDALSPTRTIAEENGVGIPFTIHRNGPTNSPLVASLTIGGNAVAGVDYQPLPTSVTFDSGSSDVLLQLIPIDNQALSQKRTVTVTLNASSAFVIGAATASMTIVDQDGAGRINTGGLNQMAGAARLFAGTTRVTSTLFSNSLLNKDSDEALLALV